MQTFLYTLHFIVCFVLIGVVLLHNGPVLGDGAPVTIEPVGPAQLPQAFLVRRVARQAGLQVLGRCGRVLCLQRSAPKGEIRILRWGARVGEREREQCDDQHVPGLTR